jgi:hypothetical protein
MDVTTALSTSTQPSSLADPLPQRWVARIFDRLTAQLGAKVADLYAGVPAGHVQTEWADALAGFHATEIDRGLRACQTRPFAPTLGEFCRLCRPALDPEFAFLEAGHCLRQRDGGLAGDWTHPAVYRAACTMSLEVRRGDYREVRKRWEWTLQRELAGGWSEIPEPPLRLAADIRTGPPTAEIREKLKGLRALPQTEAVPA